MPCDSQWICFILSEATVFVNMFCTCDRLPRKSHRVTTRHRPWNKFETLSICQLLSLQQLHQLYMSCISYHKLYVTRCYKYLVRTRERVQESWWMVANARFAHIVVGGGWTATSPPPQKMAIPSQTLGVSVQKWWMSPLKHAGFSQLSEDWKESWMYLFFVGDFLPKKIISSFNNHRELQHHDKSR